MNAKGIDLSHHNGTFTNLGNQDFIIARACNGIKEDTKYRLYVPEIKKTAIRGAYIYYRTNHVEHPPEEQAALFLELSSGKGMKILGVDYEVSDYDDNELTGETAVQLYGFMLFLASQRPSKKILLYTSIYTWRDVLLPLQGFISIFGEIDWYQFGIWLPRYGWPDDSQILKLDNEPVLPYYDVWQKNNTGKGGDFGVSSSCIDLNDYNGTVEEMLSWLYPKEDDPVKKVWTSKTIIFAVIFGIVSIAKIFGYADFVPGDELVGYVNLGVSIIVALLRVFTNQGVEL